MSRIVQKIEVDVPPPTAFEKLTRFEDLPGVLPGVLVVQQVDDRTLFWVAQILGAEVAWLLEINVDEDRLISWSSRSGPRVRGAIWLEPIGYAGTRVTVLLQHDPASVVQGMTDYFGTLRRWVEHSLVRFKELTERSYEALEHLPRADELVGQ